MTTSDNISAIEAIEKAMEGVTPGPWQTVQTRTDIQRLTVAGPSEIVCGLDGICEPDRMNDRLFAEDAANMRYIAACNPLAMSAILAEARKAEAMKRALKTPFCVLFLDGRNEYGTHVLPCFPTSIDVVEHDLAEQAEAIMSAAEAEGFTEGDLVWAEFSNVPPQIGDEGRVELSGYWDFLGINKAMSSLLKGKKP